MHTDTQANGRLYTNESVVVKTSRAQHDPKSLVQYPQEGKKEAKGGFLVTCDRSSIMTGDSNQELLLATLVYVHMKALLTWVKIVELGIQQLEKCSLQ